MKKIFLLLAMLVAVPAVMQAQEVYKFWVKLHDKEGSAYSLDNPAEFLGPRAMERRQRQRIVVDSLDLPVSNTYLQRLRQAGFMVQNRTKWLNGVTLFAVDSSLAEVLDTLSFVDTVIYCEKSTVEAPERVVPGRGLPYEPVPFESVYDSAYYNYAYPQIAQLGGMELHRKGFRGEGIVIGVCDGGFSGADTIRLFDSMRYEGRLLATRDFVWIGDQVFSNEGHGTSVLSLMASKLPGFFVGTAPQAGYVLCRTECPTNETILEEYNWISAAEYLDSLGADIITTSLGYFHFDDSTQDHTLADLNGRTAPMTVGADIAVTRGMLVLNAAGNNGSEGPGRLNSPADAARILTVGAVNIDSSWASFSSHGPTADLRLKPDVMALGSNVYCSNAMGALAVSNGTSLSTPIMAGMMACLWQRYPRLTPANLCDSARAWGHLATCPDIHSGYGIPNFARAFPQDTVLESITAETSHTKFVVFPNPCHDRVNLELSASTPVCGTVVLHDMLGRKVLSLPLSSPRMQLCLGQLPRGIYLLTLISTTASHTLRIRVQ